jgi:hypothetical protein
LKSFFGDKAGAVKKIEAKSTSITTNEIVKKRTAKN